MVQSKSDLDFLNGLHLMIDSIETSHIEKQDADYHEEYGDLQEPYDAKIGSEMMGRRKGSGGQFNYIPDQKAHGGAPERRKVPQQQGMITTADDNELPEADHWCPDSQAWHTADHEPANPPQIHINVSNNNGDDPYASENGVDKEYDQNTNLPPVSQEHQESSIAEPFLRKREAREDDDEDESGEDSEFEKSIDALKIWATVDHALPKWESELTLVDDITILKSFYLDDSTNIEELVEGTLVHKMLTDRSSRPTQDWWDAGMLFAKSASSFEMPALMAAFLYYEPDTFELDDFISLEKAEPSENGKSQDLEMMPNSSGGSPIDGLGLMADGPGPDDDEDCD